MPLDEKQLLSHVEEIYETCDFNPSCSMSLVWIINDTKINLFLNNSNKKRINFNNNLFTETEDNNVLL